ncbi:hypothetical protein HQ35_00895 [Porphyromonas cangingivalis]|uniref:Uncharacterized protein n=1 Tax=Porphyromonas cangingivalis TaxID=36874 RepID=A0A0A2EVS4_PORCN|nr:hypothetical protein HQ35_00895 [Porphyromonas cangingivalis]
MITSVQKYDTLDNPDIPKSRDIRSKKTPLSKKEMQSVTNHIFNVLWSIKKILELVITIHTTFEIESYRSSSSLLRLLCVGIRPPSLSPPKEYILSSARIHSDTAQNEFCRAPRQTFRRTHDLELGKPYEDSMDGYFSYLWITINNNHLIHNLKTNIKD